MSSLFRGWIIASFCLCRLLAAAPGSAAEPNASEPEKRYSRSTSGLLVLYDFQNGDGDIVHDRSGFGEPLNLVIDNPAAVRRNPGTLEVIGDAQIRSDSSAHKVTSFVRRWGELTIEAWIEPANVRQSGPARIVTLSSSSSARSFTLGQSSDRYEIRLTTSATSANGIPSVTTKPKMVKAGLTHLVYTRHRAGHSRIYINGKLKHQAPLLGSTAVWDDAHRLALADEFDADRQWTGTYHFVAIFGRELSPPEIQRHFKAGPRVVETPASERRVARTPESVLFESQIAPLVVDRCLECHDTATKQGGLDLSRKEASLAGGENGPAIVPGSAEESLLWHYVESDEMPLDRTPLTAEEKQLLRRWLDAGAVWGRDVIDPHVYQTGGHAGENWVRRLTVEEYIRTVRDAVGVEIADEARQLLPRDLRADGFSNTAYNLTVDLAHVRAYTELAEKIVARMDVPAFARRFSRSQQLTDVKARELIAEMGKWLLRGPLADHEVVDYRGITTTVMSSGGNFEEAIGLVIQAMLQSPRFIYRMERQRGDGQSWPVGDFELASRLSFAIWGAPPDRELMRAADAGELFDRASIAAQVKRMLADPRAVDHSQQFIHQWLDLGRLHNLRPSRARFPNWSSELATDMEQETLQFFTEIAWSQRPLSDLLNAQFTHVTPRLAEHYGLPAGEGDGRADSADRRDLSREPGRGGLLTHGSILTVGGDEASMVARGLFVMHELLRGAVKDPPPCVDTTPPPTKVGRTQRAIAETRIADSNCGGCHGKFEPLAFGLERFDGLGSYHETDEHGNALRDDGEILFPGAAKPVAYRTAAELMDLLAESDRVRQSITWKLAQFAVGRPLGAADAPLLDEIHRVAQEGGGTYSSLMRAIVMSDLVQMTPTENIE